MELWWEVQVRGGRVDVQAGVVSGESEKTPRSLTHHQMSQSMSSWQDNSYILGITLGGVIHRGAGGRWWWVTFNEGGEREKVRSSAGGRIIPETSCSDGYGCRRVGELEMSRDRLRQEADRVELVGWIVKSSWGWVSWEYCRVVTELKSGLALGFFSQWNYLRIGVHMIIWWCLYITQNQGLK